MTDKPGGGGLLVAGGSTGAGGNTYVAPTSEGWSCGPWQDIEPRLNTATTWFSARYISISGGSAGSVITDTIQNETFSVYTSPSVSPWNYSQFQYVYGSVNDYMQTRLSQNFWSYSGGALASADKIRMRGYVGPSGFNPLLVPVNFTIFRGSWGTSIPDGTGEPIYLGTATAGSNVWVEFELEPYDFGGTRYYQYFIGIDNPSALTESSGTVALYLKDYNVGYNGGNRPQMFAPCHQ